MRTMAIVLMAVALSITAGEVMAQGCGHCHEIENIFEFTGTMHQMVNENPRLRTCDVGDGSHDCVNGDDEEWFEGDCALHPIPVGGCSGFVELQTILNDAPRLCREDAMRLSSDYPKWVTYDRIAQTVVVRDCSGTIVDSVPVAVVRTPEAVRTEPLFGSMLRYTRTTSLERMGSRRMHLGYGFVRPGII